MASILDISHLDYDVYNKYVEYVKKFVSSANGRIDKVVAHSVPVLSNSFFKEPKFWNLLCFIPEKEEELLRIGEIMIAFNFRKYKDRGFEVPKEVKIGKGCLVIERLIVVCDCWHGERIDPLRFREDLAQYEIYCMTCKVIAPVDKYLYEENEHIFRRLKMSPSDEIVFLVQADIWRNHLKCPEPKVSDDPFLSFRVEKKPDIPHFEEPNTVHKFMGHFTSDFPKYDFLRESDIRGAGVVIAVLGYGFNYNEQSIKMVDHEFFVSSFLNHRHNNHYNWLIGYVNQDIAPDAAFISCQTVYGDGTIATGATAKAINWLKRKWDGGKGWEGKYQSLIVLIPYGGQYREDEMIAIHEATDDGIIIVCAAGPSNGEVVYPAALGNVISVGTTTDGPKGREIDISVSRNSNYYKTIYESSSIVDAVVKVVGLLSLLLSRMNALINSSTQAVATAIKNVKGHFHTCVIRELIVSEGSGSHDPGLGYGEGTKIFKKLLLMEDNQLLLKLADILLKKRASTKNQQNAIDYHPVEGEERELKFHGLNGNGVSVAVIDIDFPKDEIINFKMPQDPSSAKHGMKCAVAVNRISPSADIECVNKSNWVNHNTRQDILSYSTSTAQFDLELCKAVSRAVIGGQIIVFAAGNKGQLYQNTIGYPGRIGNVLVIGGRDPFYNPVGYSSVGRELDFLADATIGKSRGTSFAAPEVAGYIALLLEFIQSMADKGDQYNITAWSRTVSSRNDDDDVTYQWRQISITQAAQNVYAMRTLLRETMVPKKVNGHSEKEGFGCLDFSFLFSSYDFEGSKEFVTEQTEKKIYTTLQNFYRPFYDYSYD